MTEQKKNKRKRDFQLGFDAVSIEGGLLSPEWLSRIAQPKAGAEAEYRIRKGLNLRDEMGRYWRIAQAHWSEFSAGRSNTSDSFALAKRFIEALLRDVFEFASLAKTNPIVIVERSYPIGLAALNGRVPVVVSPAGSGLDTLASMFGDGARRRSAFGLAQEYLNAQEGALWGVATDGVSLRIVRDNASLTRPAWIEVDLQRIFTEERYADFTALWLLMHETRFGRADQPVSDCPLEVWRNAGREEGTRAREDLRRGVEDALLTLGRGFIAHPENQALRADLRSGAITTKDYFSQLLRLVYRLIFLLTVEERGLLHSPNASEAAKTLYSDGYSSRRLRDRSVKRSAHDRFADLWESVKIVFKGLGAGEPRLGLPALAGIFAANQCSHLDGATLENRALLLAVFKLGWLREEDSLVRVNWRDMGPEELGSVYESLLELVPQVSNDGRQFSFATSADAKGNARKITGSYYTPDSLVQVLLDTALEPVIEDTIAKHPGNSVAALLSLSIVDPACGSGHFLLAAARRLAAHVARIQANGTPSAAEYRHALRQVVGRCIYGVDLNPMAVELCKVSLWMEAVEPGLPLTFLNSHIQRGNALLGTTPGLMAQGIPDGAWDPIEGDDNKIASQLKKRNKTEAGGQRTLTFTNDPTSEESHALGAAVLELEAAPDVDVAALAKKETKWEDILESGVYRHQKFVADAWCAAFVWPKTSSELADAAPTNELWRRIRDGVTPVPEKTIETVNELSGQHQFFHWSLQFPHVFEKGGFDVVIGNPPWEMPETDDRVVLGQIAPDIAQETSPQKRREMLDRLKNENEQVWAEWMGSARSNDAVRALIVNSGRFPNGSLGRLNYCRVFIEHGNLLLGPVGRAGLVVQSGLWSASYDRPLWHALLRAGAVVAIFDFENRKRLFPAVDSRTRFALLAMCKSPIKDFRVAFWLQTPEQLIEKDRVQQLSLEALKTLDPEALSIPQFRDPRDLRLLVSALKLHRRFSEHPRFTHTPRLMFSSSDSAFAVTEYSELGELRSSPISWKQSPWLPVYEGKMIAHYDHRKADIVINKKNVSRPAQERDIHEAEKDDPFRFARPQHWIRTSAVRERRLGTKRGQADWELVFCDVTAATNERTTIPCILPLCGLNRSLPAVYLAQPQAHVACELLAVLSSFAFDYFSRLRVTSNHLTQDIIESLPIPDVSIMFCGANYFRDRVLELVYTAWDLESFAQDVGYNGPPFRWNKERRFHLRAELDAAFFYLYGLSREDTDYVMDTFPIVRKNDEKEHGEYRTKRVILELYDAMVESARAGRLYETRLDPPPADPRVAHPARTGVVVPFPTRMPAAEELPRWGDAIVAEAASRAQVGLDTGAWSTAWTGEALGMAALAAVLRQVGRPTPRSDVERAVVLTVLPRLMQSNLKGDCEKKWRNAIGSNNLAIDSIGSLTIPWNAVLRKAIQQGVLVEDGNSNWAPGPDVADAPSAALDARAIVVLSWLATTPAESREISKQVVALRAA